MTDIPAEAIQQLTQFFQCGDAFSYMASRPETNRFLSDASVVEKVACIQNKKQPPGVILGYARKIVTSFISPVCALCSWLVDALH